MWILIAVQGIAVLRNIPRENLLRENFPLAEDDSRYLRTTGKGWSRFCDKLSRDESFYTLSDEISIYYFVGKLARSVFRCWTWWSETRHHQRQIITDLEAGNVKFVVADFANPYYQLDGISNELRAPLVFDYIRQHYPGTSRDQRSGDPDQEALSFA